MNVANFLIRTSYALRGTDEDPPTLGDDDSNYWIDTLNRKKDELYEDTTKNWSNTFKETAPNEPGTVATTATTTLTGTGTYFTDYKAGDKITVDGETVRTIDTIASNTSLTVTVAFSNTASSKTFTHASIIATGVTSYSMHRSFLSLSGDTSTFNGSGSGAYVITTGDNKRPLEVITPERRNFTSRNVYLAGLHPQKLYFSNDIESTDELIGGTLYTPGYYMPDDVANDDATDILPFIDPNWAVMAVATEIAFNDITYEDKVEDLNLKANALYGQMVKRNRSLTFNNPRKMPTNVKRIRDTRVN